jgi:hypothetical protein
VSVANTYYPQIYELASKFAAIFQPFTWIFEGNVGEKWGKSGGKVGEKWVIGSYGNKKPAINAGNR